MDFGMEFDDVDECWWVFAMDFHGFGGSGFWTEVTCFFIDEVHMASD